MIGVLVFFCLCLSFFHHYYLFCCLVMFFSIKINSDIAQFVGFHLKSKIYKYVGFMKTVSNLGKTNSRLPAGDSWKGGLCGA